MENTQSATQDKETELLDVKGSPRSGRDAATQTPQMRHPTPARRQQARAPIQGSSSSEESLVYEDTVAYQSSMKGTGHTRGKPIPAVIIECSNDTELLTKEMIDASSEGHPSGITNLGFESKGDLVRSSSTGDFRQNTNGYSVRDPVYLQANRQMFFAYDPSDSLSPSIANANRHLYYSLPRAPRQKHMEKDLMIRSQPPTPQTHRVKDASVGMDDSTFWIFPPRAESSNSLNTIPALASKYPAQDSVNGLYTINGQSAVVTNGFSEPVIGLYEMHLVPPAATPAPSTPRSTRKFEFTKMPASVDRKRRRLQWYTDSFSLLLCIPGLLISIATPVSVFPLFYVAPEFFVIYILIFMGAGTVGALFVLLSGIVGNVVWYYDEDTKKLRPRLHCGNGPTFHFWGDSFYKSKGEDKDKELIV